MWCKFGHVTLKFEATKPSNSTEWQTLNPRIREYACQVLLDTWIERDESVFFDFGFRIGPIPIIQSLSPLNRWKARHKRVFDWCMGRTLLAPPTGDTPARFFFFSKLVTRNPKLETRDPKPETWDPKPVTRNPRPETRDPKLET